MINFSELNKKIELAKSKIQLVQTQRPEVMRAVPMTVSDIDKMLKFAV